MQDIESFKDYLLSFGIFQDPAECHAYVENHYHRILKTISLIPPGEGRLLEIGASPYCMTLIMKERLRYDISIINYGSEGDLVLTSSKHGRRYVFPCAGINVECEEFPFADGQFDVVVCAELIEHLTFCPTLTLCEIHRVLKPGGMLILSTPNLLRYFYNYEGIKRLLRGANIYDPYSGYGPYGRHNREFTAMELKDLLEGCGFRVENVEIADAPEIVEARRNKLYRALVSLVFGVRRDAMRRLQGAQIFVSARPVGHRTVYLPDNLYKSTHALDRARKVFPKIP